MKHVQLEPTARTVQDILNHPSGIERAFRIDKGASIRAEPDWQRAMSQLSEWKDDSSRFAEDDLVPPSDKSFDSALLLTAYLSRLNVNPPARIAPNGDGGIVMENKTGATLERIVLDSDGTIEWFRFKDAQLLDRQVVTQE